MAVVCFTFFSVLWFPYPIQSSDTYKCQQAFECSNQHIDLTEGGVKNVYGEGYKSIFNSSIGFSSDTRNSTVQCTGAFSCYKIENIEAPQTVIGDGDNSLSYSQSESLITAKTIDCLGSSSCAYSTLYGQDSSAVVNCYGDQSCRGATISFFGVINGRGAYSLAHSSIDSATEGTSNNITINLSGNYAGYNATIKCNNDDFCFINCYGNGCNGTLLDCNSDASLPENCIVNIDECDIYLDTSARVKYVNSTDCPITATEIETGIFRLVSLEMVEDIGTMSSEVDYFCSNKSSLNVLFDNSSAILNNTFGGLENEDGYLCCRGEKSCKGADYVAGRKENKDVYCGAKESCAGVGSRVNDDNANGTYYGIFAKRPGSRIFCTASKACQNVQYMTSLGGIYCSGDSSCSNSNIFNTSKLYCSGYPNTCANTTISRVRNITIAGEETAVGARIMSNGVGALNVYFDSYKSGDGVEIHCNSLYDECNIYCGTSGACNKETTVIYCGVNFTSSGTDGTIYAQEIEANCSVECSPDAGIECPLVIGPTNTSTTIMTTVTNETATTMTTGGGPILPESTMATTIGTNVQISGSTTDDINNPGTTTQMSGSDTTMSTSLNVSNTTNEGMKFLFLLYGSMVYLIVFWYLVKNGQELPRVHTYFCLCQSVQYFCFVLFCFVLLMFCL